MYSEYNYEPTDIDDEIFLSEVPVGLLEKAIETQFNDPLEYRKKDYVQSFLTKYSFSKENMYEEEQNDLDTLHDDFIAFMLNIFRVYLGIGIENMEDIDEIEQHEIIHLTYRFFIKNIKKNFTTLVVNYINEYKQELVEMMGKKKDVTSLNFKIEIENEDDVCILSNLDEVIEYILSQNFTIDDFLRLCVNDSNCLETEYVTAKFNDFILTGNFVPKYIDMLNSSFRFELESKVRNKILKKYPIRKKEEPVNSEDVTTTDTEK